jgi:hypothetical protein
MPWLPELFSASIVEKLEETYQEAIVSVPFFYGMLTGEIDALVASFAGEPQLQHPVRGRVRGERAFREFVAETDGWLAARNVSVEEGQHVVTRTSGFEEMVLSLEGKAGRVEIPHALVADHDRRGRLEELRVYFSNWPLTGRHANRPPLLSRDPDLRERDVVGEYQRALGTGDLDAILSVFAEDGYAREPAGNDHVHRGPAGLRAFYERLFSNSGGIELEHCTATDDGHFCALEYNVVRWGQTELPPQAGVAVYERGADGKLAAARIYDDVDPPVSGL